MSKPLERRQERRDLILRIQAVEELIVVYYDALTCAEDADDTDEVERIRSYIDLLEELRLYLEALIWLTYLEE